MAHSANLRVESSGTTLTEDSAPPKASIDSEQLVTIDYTNYRGERSLRKIKPIGIVFAGSEWHSEPQWLLEAFDISRGADRVFALRDIHSWRS
jgi:predicted DNA-binding transcriptional regulator YafY